MGWGEWGGGGVRVRVRGVCLQSSAPGSRYLYDIHSQARPSGHSNAMINKAAVWRGGFQATLVSQIDCDGPLSLAAL